VPKQIGAAEQIAAPSKSPRPSKSRRRGHFLRIVFTCSPIKS
jgi:hypothetical protein